MKKVWDAIAKDLWVELLNIIADGDMSGEQKRKDADFTCLGVLLFL